MAMEEDVKRRVRAGRMLQAGKKPAEIAVAVGVARQTVYTWKRILEESGIDALREIDRGGRPGSLDKEQFEQIRRALLESPTAHGFGTELWTIKRVRVLIERLHGVRFSEVHVWRILGRLGFSSQKPERRSLERNEEAIVRWKKREWPRLKKKSLRRGQTDRIRRRIGVERTTHASAHLGAQGTNACGAVSFQLEAALDHCGTDAALLLLPLVPRNDQERADRNLPQSAAPTAAATTAHHLGRTAGASLAPGARLRGQHPGRSAVGLPAALRARAQPRRIPLGLAQTPRLGELLSREHECAAQNGTQQTALGTATRHYHRGLLEAGIVVLMSSC